MASVVQGSVGSQHHRPHFLATSSGYAYPFPPSFTRNPVVLLDSGRSVAESIFLERFRQAILQRLNNGRRRHHRVWVLYRDRKQWARHGAHQVGQYDEWEVRPVRWHSDLYRAGFFATVAGFEDGCHHLHIRSPWRFTHPFPKRRAIVVYLAPEDRDLQWLVSHREKWQQPYNIPELHLGVPWNRRVNAQAGAYAARLWCFDRKAQGELNAAYGGKKAWTPGWLRWWLGDILRNRIAVAQPWRDPTVQRFPDMGRKIAEDVAKETGIGVHLGPDDATWEACQDATASRFYFILSKAEPYLPFDALIALGKGATLIAPDAEPFRCLPGKKLLYPVRANHDGTAYDFQFGTLRAELLRAFRTGKAGAA